MEDDEEEVGGGERDDASDGSVDDAAVERTDGYSKEKEGDGEAGEGCCYGIEDFT